MGLVAWKLKLASPEKLEGSLDSLDLDIIPGKVNEYKTRIRDLVIHVCNNDFI